MVIAYVSVERQKTILLVFNFPPFTFLVITITKIYSFSIIQQFIIVFALFLDSWLFLK